RAGRRCPQARALARGQVQRSVSAPAQAVLVEQAQEVNAIDTGGGGGSGDVAAVLRQHLGQVLALEAGQEARLGVVEGGARARRRALAEGGLLDAQRGQPLEGVLQL